MTDHSLKLDTWRVLGNGVPLMDFYALSEAERYVSDAHVALPEILFRPRGDKFFSPMN